MWVEHDPITRGQIQTVNFNVTDNETGKPIHGANIDGYTIYNPQPHRINLHIVTNDSGKASYSWKVPHDTIPGLFITSAKISAEGYAYDDFKEITFEVK
jgi:hypothetical protein